MSRLLNVQREPKTIPPLTEPTELTLAATSIPVEHIVATFAAQAARSLRRLQLLTEAEWEQPTRCEEWSVRELVHHLVTSTERAIDLLDPVAGPGRLTFSGMDPLSTPEGWMRLDGPTPPGALLARYQAAMVTMIERAEVLAADDADFTVHGPIGRVPWPLFLLHVLWDLWLHDRDVFIGTPLELPPQDDEARLVGIYSLFIAAEVARLSGVRLATTVRLHGVGGGTWWVEVSESTRVRLVEDGEHAEIVGPAVAAFEALCGRGPPLAVVVEGEARFVSGLSALANFFRSTS